MEVIKTELDIKLHAIDILEAIALSMKNVQLKCTESPPEDGYHKSWQGAKVIAKIHSINHGPKEHAAGDPLCL